MSTTPSNRVTQKIVLVLGMVLSIVPANLSHAALLAYEGFDYPTGSSIVGQNGGLNFADAWQLNGSGAGSIYTNASNSLTYTDANGNTLLTSGNHAFFAGSFTANNTAQPSRDLTSARTSGTTWISFLGVRQGTTTNVIAGNPYPRGANVALFNGGTERLGIGNPTGAATNSWSLVPANTPANIRPTVSPFNNLSFVVVRIDHLGDAAAADNVYIFINPVLGVEPPLSAAATNANGLADFGFNRIRPFAGGYNTGGTPAGQPNAQLRVDEIRVGETYADVTPQVVLLPTITWDGGGIDDNWSTASNWSNDNALSLSGDIVAFAGAIRPTPNLDDNYSLAGLLFDASAGNFNVGTANNSVLSLTGGVINNSVNSQSLNVPIALSGAQTFKAAAGDLIFGSVITNGGSALTITGVSNTTLSGNIVGAGNFTKNGPGTLRVPGNLLSTGRVNFNQGTSVLMGAVSPGTSELWVSDGAGNEGVLNVSTGATVTVSNWLAMGRTGAKGTLNVNGGTITRAGGGNLTLGTLGTTPLGIINLNSGSISNLTGETYLGEGSSTFNFGIYNQSGGIAHLGNLYLGRGASGGQGIGTATVSGGTLIAGNIEIGFGNNNTRIGTNVMSINPGATVNAAGHLRLAFAGSASLWGILTNNGGTLNVGATALYMGYWPDGCSARLTLNSGAVNLHNNASIIFGQNGNAGPGNVFLQNGGNVTFYSDAGLTVGGSGSLNLGNSGAGAHTYTLAGGTLTVPQIRKAGGTSTATFNFNGGILRPTADSTTFLQGLTAANVLPGGAIIDTDGKNITIAQPLIYDFNFSSGGLTKLGAGTLTLSGNGSSYTGITRVNDGSLAVSGGDAIGNSSSVILSNAVGVTLSLNSNEVIGSLAGGGGIGGNVILGPNTLTVLGSGFNSIYSGTVSGSGGFTKSGSGTQILIGTNTYSGPTDINGGTLRVDGRLNGTGLVTVGISGVLAGSGVVNGVTTVNGQITPGTSIGTLTFSNAVTLNSRAITVMELNRTNIQTADMLVTFGDLAYGGTLRLINIGPAFMAGDSFDLFNAVSTAGSFSTIVLPLTGPDLEWDLTQLHSNGTVSVVAAQAISGMQTNYQRVHSFGFPEMTGNQPFGPFVEAQDGKLYGTTQLGGINGGGTVFTISKTGTNYQVIHAFSTNGITGKSPMSGLLEATDGFLYGTTSEGGTSNLGTIFRLNTNGGDFMLVHSFSGATGADPKCDLIEASDGKLYGTTVSGGASNSGVVFGINKDGNGFTLLREFTGLDGSRSFGGVIEATDGALYGTTSQGGTMGFGTVFKVNKDGSGYTLVRQFAGGTDANSPAAKVIEASDGALYGTTIGGGSLGVGTVFKVNKDGTGYGILKSFIQSGNSDGCYPQSPLMEGSDGALYGTTPVTAFVPISGSVFKINKNGTGFTVLRRLVTSFGGNLMAPVIEASDGMIYGTAASGGTGFEFGHGILFRMEKDGTNYTTLWDMSLSGTDAVSPEADLIEGTDGMLYGASKGSDHYGTLFKTAKDGSAYSLLHVFSRAPTTNFSNGLMPNGVIEATDGFLYGTCNYGGSNGVGNIFRLNKDGSSYTVLRHFLSIGSDGQSPDAALVEASDSALYGTTSSGGSNNLGTIFKINKDGSGYATIWHFSVADGQFPIAELIEGSDGMLYGTAQLGGSGNFGTLFRLNKDGTGFSVVKAFTASVDGITPQARLLEGSDGVLYGTTSTTIFKMNKNGSNHVVLMPLGSSGGLIEGTNGALYGATTSGIVFGLNKGGGAVTLLTLTNSSNGTDPRTSLVQSSDGSLYGTTYAGGDMNYGVIFALLTSSTIESNNPPIVSTPIPDQTNTYGNAFSFTFPANTFTEPDAGQFLSYSATGLPAGISLDGPSRTFSGTNNSVGSFAITVTATDNGTPPMNTNNTFDLVVHKAPLVVTADNQSRNYGDTNPPFTVNFSGFVFGETDDVLDTPPQATSLANTNSPVGSYGISATGGVDDQYSFSYSNGVLTVSPVPLTVTADSTNRVQGAPNPAFSGTLVGIVNNDDLTATFTTMATLESPPGTYLIVPQIQDPDLRLSNYTVATNPGTLTILMPPTVSLTPQGSNNLLTLSWPEVPSGFLLEETPTLTPVNWQVITNGISSGGGLKAYVVTNDFNTPSRLFRLRLP